MSCSLSLILGVFQSFTCVCVCVSVCIAAQCSQAALLFLTLRCVCRLEIDLARLPVKQRQLYTRVLDPGKGRLVFLITLTPCTGVSVSDLRSPPLDDLETSERVLDQYVSRTCLDRQGKEEPIRVQELVFVCM